MSLSDAQKASCFEILDITNAAAGEVHNGYGGEFTLSRLNELRDTLNTYLAALDAASETKVAAIVVEWDAIGFNTGRMDSGGAGEVNGISYDWDAKRRLLRDRLLIYVPLPHIVDAARRMAGPGSASFAIVR